MLYGRAFCAQRLISVGGIERLCKRSNVWIEGSEGVDQKKKEYPLGDSRSLGSR